MGTSGVAHLYPDKLIRFRVDGSKVLPEFLKAVMNSPFGRERIEGFCRTTAGNIGISAKNLKSIQVPAPAVAEQKRIVDYLDRLQTKVDRARLLQQRTTAQLSAMFPSVLEAGFRGTL